MTLNKNYTVEVQMMIRKPIATVFNAMIDPAITTKFWFTKSTGKLEQGESIHWEWEMYGVSTDIKVKQIIPNKLIKFEWNDLPTTVEFEYSKLSESTTLVVIRNYGFDLNGDDLINAIKDNTGGFTTILDGMKAYLEYGIQLNLVADKFPNNRI